MCFVDKNSGFQYIKRLTKTNLIIPYPDVRSAGLHKTKGDARVVKLVDTLDLGSSAERLGGSSPPSRTDRIRPKGPGHLYCRVVPVGRQSEYYESKTTI